MWREQPTGYFENFIIDSPNVKGITGIKAGTHFRLKHLGYINKEIVDKKASLYRTIIPEKESTFQEMYMHGEKKIKWIDNRASIKVIALNFLLDVLLFKNLCFKAFYKITNRFKKKTIVAEQAEIKAPVITIKEEPAFSKN